MSAAEAPGEVERVGATRGEASASGEGSGSVPYASEVLGRATRVNGLRGEDWAKLASVRHVTMPWGPSIGVLWHRCVLVSGELNDSISTLQMEDVKEGVAFWFERIVAGEPTSELWAETAFLGLSHAGLGLSTGCMLGFLNRLDALITLNSAKAFPIEQAVGVGSAFTRVVGAAMALMAHAHQFSVQSAATQLGVSPKLMTRLRTELVPKMIADGEESFALMTWNDSLVTGVAQLDGWHQEIIERLDRLHRARAMPRDSSELGLALQSLADGLVEQAAFEERLYVAHAFPELERHREVHQQLVTRVRVFVEDCMASEAAHRIESFARNFRGWFLEHLRVDDRPAGAFLRSQGVR